MNNKNTIFSLALSILVAFIAGLQLIHFASWSPYELATHGILMDDAYFYSTIAENFHKYGFLTLNGNMSTNGVQPLWMVIQIILTKLLPNVDSVVIISRCSWICYVLFAFFITRFISRKLTVKSMIGATIIMSGLVVLNVRFQHIVMRGLEAPIMLTTLVMTLYAIDYANGKITSSITKRTSSTILLAIASALAFFSRTDLFWISVVVFIWLLVVNKSMSREVILFSVIVFALVFPYLVFNYVAQHSLMPISGRVKLFYLNSFYPDLRSYFLGEEWRGLFSAFTYSSLSKVPIGLAVLLTITVIVACFAIVFFHRKDKTFPTSIKLLCIAIIGHIIYMQFVYRELRPYTNYYFAPEMLLSAMIIAFYIARIISLKNNSLLVLSQKCCCIVLIFACAFMGIHFGTKNTIKPSKYWIERIHLADDIKKMIPEDEPVGAFWPGAFAYFSQRRIAPLDGIIGSDEYFQKYVKTSREMEYLTENSIKYVAIYLPEFLDDHFPEATPHISHWSNLGIERLWKYHNSLQLISSNTVNSHGKGWYLFKLKQTEN